MILLGIPLAVQWLGLHAFTDQGPGLIQLRFYKPHSVDQRQKKKTTHTQPLAKRNLKPIGNRKVSKRNCKKGKNYIYSYIYIKPSHSFYKCFLQSDWQNLNILMTDCEG